MPARFSEIESREIVRPLANRRLKSQIERATSGKYVAWIESSDLRTLLDISGPYRTLNKKRFDYRTPYFTIDLPDANREIDSIDDDFVSNIVNSFRAEQKVEVVLKYGEGSMTYDCTVHHTTLGAIKTTEAWFEVRLPLDNAGATSFDNRFLYAKDVEALVAGIIYDGDMSEFSSEPVAFQLDDTNGAGVRCGVLIDRRTGELHIMSSEQV